MTRARPFVRSGIAAALLLLPVLPSTAMAADDGLGGLFQRLFQPEQPVVMQPAPMPDVAAPSPRRLDARRAARALNTRHRSIRYAALPKAEPLKIRITDRQTPIDMKDGAAAAFLKDPTLRPGDIVVMNDGAKVFTGNPDRPHAARDFVSIGRSAFIDRHTRSQLSAMVLPVGAIPAAEARRIAARAPKVPLIATLSAPVETASMRIIAPWTVAASK